MVSTDACLLQAKRTDRHRAIIACHQEPAVPTGPLITIIDDDASMRSATASLLRSAGYATRCFESADAYLAAAENQRGDCVLTDISMPGSSGLALAEHLRTTSPALPFILMTARTEPAILTRAATSGAVCVLRKPFSADQLIACVERALSVDLDTR